MDLSFTAPGPGFWELEAGHHGRRPLSGFIAAAYKRGFEDGIAAMLANYGLPLARVRFEFVHGCTYVRPVGVGEGDKPGPTPPKPIMKLFVRLHPVMRRRNRAAAQAWHDKRWRADVDRWFDHDREQVSAANLRYQAIDVQRLDDAALVAHVAELLAHFETQARLNLQHHGGDIIPIGDYLAHCARWGIAPADASALLRGSSPATIASALLLAPVARALATAAVRPTSIEAVRSLDPDARRGVDEWLARHAWRVMTTDDIDRPTLAERPELQLAALLAAAAGPTEAPEPPDTASVRVRVPPPEQALFDELLAEARYGLRQRDDVVGTRWNWSAGLLRRAVVAAGDRLASRGLLQHAEHGVELSPDEIGPLLLSGVGPDAGTVAARATFRDLVGAAGAPASIGEPEAPPPLDVLPRPMARATAALMTMLEVDMTSATTDALQGTGIGTACYKGIARVVTSADDALDRLQPGDVLIAHFTGPSYNSILPILGALVVETGGPMCHAAIVAREFGLPAIIGATGATTHVPDGALVEVDPIAGVVRIAT
ncbi:MAG: PEP-utilizing enzyme [Acidimicrobiales bacterium]